MDLFDGKSANRVILNDLKDKIVKEKINPVLAIILVGDDQASQIYIKLKKEAGSRIGIEVRDFLFGVTAAEDQIIKKIKEINNDPVIDGLIVQLPLPEQFDENKIIESIDPKKDVDGFHKKNQEFLGENDAPYFLPVLPKAILFTLQKAFDGSLKSEKIIALVNSDIFGQVLTAFLRREGIDLEYVIKDSLPKEEVEAKLQLADAIITVCGYPKLITENNIKEGAALIDAGITRDTDGVVKGDVDRESVKDRAGFLTPVPGGIGPLTVAFLLENVYLAASKNNHHG